MWFCMYVFSDPVSVHWSHCCLCKGMLTHQSYLKADTLCPAISRGLGMAMLSKPYPATSCCGGSRTCWPPHRRVEARSAPRCLFPCCARAALAACAARLFPLLCRPVCVGSSNLQLVSRRHRPAVRVEGCLRHWQSWPPATLHGAVFPGAEYWGGGGRVPLGCSPAGAWGTQTWHMGLSVPFCIFCGCCAPKWYV